MKILGNFNCSLIGPNGSGKTVVGKMLAKFLEVKFIDSDLECTKRCAQPLTTLWNSLTTQELGNYETELLQKMIHKKNLIIATSVNSITKLENRQLLKLQGKIIYLAANPVNQYIRSILSPRPSPYLSSSDNKFQYLLELAKIMEPLYNSIADCVIVTDDCLIEEVVNKIIDYLYCGIYC